MLESNVVMDGVEKIELFTENFEHEGLDLD